MTPRLLGGPMLLLRVKASEPLLHPVRALELDDVLLRVQVLGVNVGRVDVRHTHHLRLLPLAVDVHEAAVHQQPLKRLGLRVTVPVLDRDRIV